MLERTALLLATAGALCAGCERDRALASKPEASRPRVVEPPLAACAGRMIEVSELGGGRWRLSCLDGQPYFESEAPEDDAPDRDALTEAQWDAAWARIEEIDWRGAYDCDDMDHCGAHSEPMATGEYAIAVTVPEGERRFRCTMSCGELPQPHAQLVAAVRAAEPGQPTPFVDGPPDVEVLDRGAPTTAKRCGEDWGIELNTSSKHGASSTLIRCESGRPMRRDEWDQTPDTHSYSGPDRVALADWDALWTAVEGTQWRTLLDCTSDGGSPYESWSVVISDSAGRRKFGGRGSRFDIREPCRSLVRTIDAQISKPRNRM